MAGGLFTIGMIDLSLALLKSTLRDQASWATNILSILLPVITQTQCPNRFGIDRHLIKLNICSLEKKQTLEWFRKMREIFFKEMWRRENFRWWSMEAEPFHRSYQSFRTTGTQREGNKTKFFWRIKKVFSLVKRDSLVRPITSSILVHTLPFYSIENDSSTSAGASKEPPQKVFTNGNWTYFDVMSFYCPGSMGQ